MAGKTWFPLESNPTIMTNYVQSLGVDTSLNAFHDVLSVESWALEMVPGPILGVLMLFPIKPSTEAYRVQEKDKIKAEGQICSENVFFMKQTVGNACGTIGLLHCVINAKDMLSITPGSFIDRFAESTRGLSPDEGAAQLEASEEIEVTHVAAAAEGQSEQVEHVDDVDTHFVCFTHVDGHLYELDGRKPFPINHGPSSQETLLADACAVVQKFMDRDPGEMRFTIVALGGPASEE